jgi:hypothetical protein
MNSSFLKEWLDQSQIAGQFSFLKKELQGNFRGTQTICQPAQASRRFFTLTAYSELSSLLWKDLSLLLKPAGGCTVTNIVYKSFDFFIFRCFFS